MRRILLPSDARRKRCTFARNPERRDNRGSWPGAREDCVVKIDLFRSFVAETGMSRSQKGFYEDMGKCNVGVKTVMGKHYYFGIKRKEIPSAEDE
jgi:hypothetical protein